MNNSILLVLCCVLFKTGCLAEDALESSLTSPANTALVAELKVCSHRVLFESHDGTSWDLFVVNADGSGRKNLTRSPDVHELYPQASPDGKRIAFLADVDRDGDTLRSVYVMNVDGSGQKIVAERARQPCWSPDGHQIAFVRQEFNRFRIKDFVSTGIFFYDVRTGETTRHPNEKIEHLYGLAWSADGKWIVSTVHGGMGYGHAILAIEVGGAGVYDLKIGGCRPCLGPDGKRITWSRDDHTVCVADLDLDGTPPAVSNVTVVQHHPKLHLYHPDFSPDGKYIVFSAGPGGRMPTAGPGTHAEVAEMVGVRGKWNLFVKAVSGVGTAVRITSDADLSNKEADWIRAGTIATGTSR